MPVTTTVHSDLTSGFQTMLTIAHTSDANPLYVLLTWWTNGLFEEDIISSVTWNGVGLTRGGHASVYGGINEWYRIGSPASGAHNLVITASAARLMSAAVVNLSGWPSSIGAHSFACAGGYAADIGPPTVTVPSKAGAEVIDWVGFNHSFQSVTPGAGQTQLWDQEGLAPHIPAPGWQMSAGSSKTGASPSVTTSWGFSQTDDGWSHAALSWTDRPVVYEDPCTIEDPRYHCKITTETETLRYSTHPLRNSAALGGFHEPRVLECSDIIRMSSNPSTGSWQAQTGTLRLADTDRANRARSADRFGLRNCDIEYYLTSRAQAVTDGPPRLLMAGKINNDPKPENLVLEVVLNDLIGNDYAIFGEEKQIPQRVIEANWFANAAKDVLRLGEPIVVGQRRPLDPANGEGVHPCRTVGRITIGATPGTPTATTLASIVSLLNTSGAAGTLYVDYGGKIGFADATVLQSYYDSHGTVPTTYDALASIIGYEDLNAWLNETATTGGTEYVAAIVASHAIKAIRNGSNGQASVWVDDTQLDPSELNVSWFIDLSRDITGADGRVRRYALIRFTTGSTYGDLVENGGRVHVDCDGMEDVGDSSGTLLEDAFDCYKHLLRNFWLQDYQSGAWLTGPTFLFADDTTAIDRIYDTSFDDAKAVAQLQIAQGRLWSFSLADRQSIRTVIQKANVCSGGLLAVDDYQRLKIRTLDFRRTNFYTNAFGEVHRTLKHKVDIWGFWLEPKPDWQCNKLNYTYAKNDYTGQFERGAGGGGTDLYVKYQYGIDRDGLCEKSATYDFVADDLTGLTLSGNFRDLFANLPHVAHYKRRGFCGLEDDVLDGLPITHYNGYGASGWQDHATWLIGKNVKQYHTEYTGLDVEPLLSALENPQPTVMMQSPVALFALVSSTDSSTVCTASS